MTVSINNSTYDNCPICGEEYSVDPRTDTQKIVELSCHHFFHMDCISDWFYSKQKEGQDLTCGYCTQLSIPKMHIRNSFTQTDLTDFFAQIKQDAVSLRNHDLIDCVEHLKPHLTSLLNTLNDFVPIQQENAIIENSNRIDNWVKGTVEKKFQGMACHLIKQLYVGSTVVSPLQEEVVHLAKIPYSQWPEKAERNGFSVLHFLNDGKWVKISVSKQHMEREVISYLSERIKKDILFESILDIIRSDYSYDELVIQAIPYAKNVQKEFSELLQQKSFSSREEMLLSLQESIHKLPIKEDIKETVSFIVYKFLFRRGALRTLPQEIKRWEKKSIDQLPQHIRSKGVRVWQEDNETKTHNVKNFIELLPSHRFHKIRSYTEGAVFSAIVIGIVAQCIFNKLR